MTIDKDYVVAASAIQEQFWLIQRLNPETTGYNIPSLFFLHGNFDTKAFQKSIDKIVARHEIFRTVFHSEHGKLVQIIQPAVATPLNQHDLSTKRLSKDHHLVKNIIQAEADRPFDLAEGPLLRCMLVRLSQNQSLLLIVMHHIITDLHTDELFAGELSELYLVYSSTQPCSLAASACPQYRDYAAWQHEWMESDEYRQMLASWQDTMAQRDGYLHLPLDTVRPAVASFRGGASTFALPCRLVEKLTKLAGQQKINLFLLLLASYYVVLHRSSGQSEIIVGVPFTNRRKANHKEIMGCFVNNIPIALDMQPTMYFAELLQLLRKEMLLAHRRQEVPFKEIVSATQKKGNTTHNPLFQVGFTFQPPMQIALAGIIATPEPVRSSDIQLDLFPVLWETDGGVAGYVEFNADLFQQETIDRFVEHWHIFLAHLAEGRDAPISQLPVLGQEEKRTLLELWNSTHRAYRGNCCLHTLFEEQVARTPKAPALFVNDVILTYEELNNRANQLGHYLQKQGMGSDTLVGVFMERSMEMVVALYGILKAGAAYVPLDPSFPEDRLTFMMEDADLAIILTQKHLQSDIPAKNSKVVCLDTEWHLLEREKSDAVVSDVKGNNLAYVIYTSGSTGRPKGAMNQHDAVCNRLFWMQDEFQLTPADRVLQKTPYSFDVSVWEFFWPLQVGASLVMAPPNSHYDPLALSGLIEKFAITTIHFVPSMLHVFLDAPGLQRCRSLKYLICSGEALSHDLQDKVFHRLSAAHTELYNLYGPTEAAVDVTCWRCRRDYQKPVVPIGRPIANTRLYIVDKFLQPTPIGVPGELLIGGVQVARGYLKRPELTAANFIGDVFSNRPGARLYKTGDLARYLPDGTIEYLGRLDHQIKLYGLRIELGEIEALTSEYDLVQQAVAAVVDMPSGEKALAVYVVIDKHQELSAKIISQEIKNFLARKLPTYMVPAFVITLTELPLTTSGKVNRKALPLPTGLQAEPPTDAALAGKVEIKILQIWQKILKHDKISGMDNFFDVGGDSLLAIMVVAEINKAFECTIPVVKLFQYPTISALAQFMTTEHDNPAPATLQQSRSLRQRAILAEKRKKRGPE
jgi:amino acid adenylation domain-containing protein